MISAALLVCTAAMAGCVDKAAQQRFQDRLTSVEAQMVSIQAQLDQFQSTADENRSSILILEDKLDTARQYINTIKTNQELKIIRVTPEMMATASDLPAPAEPKAAVREPKESRETRAAPKAAIPAAPSVSMEPVQPVPVAPVRSKAVASVEAAPKKSDYRNPLDLYGAAYKLFEAGNYDEGTELFREFVRRWPNHDYADNSQYWIGECYYSRAEYEDSMTEFQKVLKRYPTGNKAPDALLKIGFSLKKLGRDKEASSTLQRLLNEYPFSDAAPKARDRLADWAQGRE